jgi:HSP20 family protein
MVRVRELSKRDDFFWPIQLQFNKLYNEFFSNKRLDASKSSIGYPKMDILESENKWVIQAAVPGVDPEFVNVEITPENTVRIYGEMTDKLSSDDSVYYMKELRRSRFEREIRLPDNLSGEPEAIVKDGVLTLSWDFENEEEEPEAKLIEVKKG